MELQGKTALITGATGKIGRALVPALAREGIHCVCHYHRQEGIARDLAAEAEGLGCKALAVQADFREDEQIREMFRQAQGIGPIDLLIQTTGLFAKTPIAEADESTARDMIQVNLTAPILLTRLLVESPAKRDALTTAENPIAKIVYFTDASAIRPWKRYCVYCASKAGLEAVTKSLAKELAPAVTVNAVAPGIVEGTLPDPAEELRQIGRIPGGRFPAMKDIVQTVLFILKNDSITGQILRIDGGSVL